VIVTCYHELFVILSGLAGGHTDFMHRIDIVLNSLEVSSLLHVHAFLLIDGFAV